jgi:hypothetical protein
MFNTAVVFFVGGRLQDYPGGLGNTIQVGLHVKIQTLQCTYVRPLTPIPIN